MHCYSSRTSALPPLASGPRTPSLPWVPIACRRPSQTPSSPPLGSNSFTASQTLPHLQNQPIATPLHQRQSSANPEHRPAVLLPSASREVTPLYRPLPRTSPLRPYHRLAHRSATQTAQSPPYCQDRCSAAALISCLSCSSAAAASATTFGLAPNTLTDALTTATSKQPSLFPNAKDTLSLTLS